MVRAATETKVKYKADTAGAKRNVNALASATDKLGGAVVAAVAAFASWQAVKTLLADSVKAAAATERSYNVLRASVQRAGIAWEEAETGLRAFTDQMQTMTGVADEEFAFAIGLFLDLGLDMRRTLDSVRLSMDLAISKGEDFRATARFLAESYANSTTSLAKWGVKIDQTLPKLDQIDEAMRELNEQVGGTALEDAESMATAIGVMAQKFGDLQENIGKLIEGPLVPLIDHVNNLLTVVNALETPLEKFGMVLKWALAARDPATLMQINAELLVMNALIEEQNRLEIERVKTAKEESNLRSERKVKEIELGHTIRVVGDQFGRYIKDIEKASIGSFHTRVRAHKAMVGAMRSNAEKLAAAEMSLAKFVAKSVIDTAADAVAQELEIRATLWAAKAIAAAAEFNFYSAAKFTAAAAMGFAGAGLVRAAAASFFAAEDHVSEDIDAIETVGKKSTVGRTLVQQGPVTLNYNSTFIVHGSLFGIDDMHDQWDEWNLSNLRRAGYDAEERATG